jgi:hypothetical protein
LVFAARKSSAQFGANIELPQLRLSVIHSMSRVGRARAARR